MSRPHQNDQDFIARIHGTCTATVCMHQPCLVQGFILTNSHASVRQSKTRFRHCLRVSGTTSCVHLKDLCDHFCAAIKFQNSQGDVANNSHCKWAFGRWLASCKSDFDLSTSTHLSFHSVAQSMNNKVSFRFQFNHGLISIRRFSKASSKRLRSS